MPLYHISKTEYQVGDEFKAKTVDSEFHDNAVEKGNGWVNDVLDEGRPNNAPSRKRAYYAFDSYEYCIHYFKGEYGLDTPYFLYEVELTDTISSPMYLTKLLLKNSNNDLTEMIVREYWNRTVNWGFIEYLGNSMRIISSLEPDVNNPLAEAKDTYADDVIKAIRFLKNLNR